MAHSSRTGHFGNEPANTLVGSDKIMGWQPIYGLPTHIRAHWKIWAVPLRTARSQGDEDPNVRELRPAAGRDAALAPEVQPSVTDRKSTR